MAWHDESHEGEAQEEPGGNTLGIPGMPLRQYGQSLVTVYNAADFPEVVSAVQFDGCIVAADANAAAPISVFLDLERERPAAVRVSFREYIVIPKAALAHIGIDVARLLSLAYGQETDG